VNIAQGEDDVLILASTVVIDMAATATTSDSRVPEAFDGIVPTTKAARNNHGGKAKQVRALM
jgi:hypothetical protein